jgi:predicted short-subunit dehydrogenase-like oxidoreductase (DUF2520 family)
MTIESSSLPSPSVRQPIALLGAGGAGRALGVALVAAGFSVSAVWSRRRERAEELASLIPGSRVCSTPHDAAGSGRLVVLAVPDSAIAPLCASLSWRPDQAVIHLAGAFGRELLAAAARAGAATGAFHPLQTFAGAAVPTAWQGIAVAIEADPSLQGELLALAQQLGSRPFLLSPEQRPLYHAAAVLAANGLVALAGVAAELIAQATASDRATALRSLFPLLSGVLANLDQLGLPQALTGPVARADRETIERHIEALAHTAPTLLPLYRALAQAMLPLARERAAAAPERLVALDDLQRWLASEEVAR